MNAIIPRHPVQVRLATPGDLPFIDALQKRHGKQLGFMPESWLEPRIAKGEVIIAEGAGYIVAQDKYKGREELGLVVQLCVDPSKQRGLVGAMLVRAAFERAAYGCKLFCLWCAQDIAANHFWESIGFVPLAYREGSEKKRRVHIFWQKRIREGDTTTPWWFPSSTTGGAMGAGRIVLPIPPGKHWSDELPILTPALSGAEGPNDGPTDGQAKQIDGPFGSAQDRPRERTKRKAAAAPVAPVKRLATRTLGAPRVVGAEPAPAPTPVVAKVKKERAAKKRTTCPERSRRKNDPRLVAAARELRDRWLEHVNEMNLIGCGKYDVARMLPPAPARADTPALLLPAA